jgi:hypothetical protein
MEQLLLMGILNWLGLATAKPDFLAGPTDISSPWASDSTAIQRFALSEALGVELAALPLSRMEALQIPAVAKARNLLVSSIAPRPLIVRNAEGPITSQPTWAYRTDAQNSAETPFMRMAGIVDDGLFYGHSLLAIQRGAAGQVLRIARVPMDRWKISQGRILVDEQPVDSSEVAYIAFAHEGLLNIGGPTLRGARDLQKAWLERAKSPVPQTVLKDTRDINLTDAEITAMKSGYATQRASDGSSVAYVPKDIDVQFGQSTGAAELFEGAQNASVTYIGQLANIRASMLDGTLADSSSLTYTTQAGERSAFFALDVPFWARAIEDRLSQDDIVPAGQSVAFDFSDLFAANAPAEGAPRED